MNEAHGLSKHARRVTGLTIALVAALVIGGTVYEQSQISLSNPQQTFVSTTTSVVVVPIPGFSIESLILGILLGLTALSLVRSRKLGAGKYSSQMLPTVSEHEYLPRLLNDRTSRERSTA